LTYLAAKGYWPPPAGPRGPVPTHAFELATLAVLRIHTGADVAMLQKRDFYWGPFPKTLNDRVGAIHPNGELLERILWMGNYLQVLTVKGDTLKKVLDDSAKFDTLDEQSTLEKVEVGRALLTLGIQTTRDKQYLSDAT